LQLREEGENKFWLEALGDVLDRLATEEAVPGAVFCLMPQAMQID
jgi:hypothetical protein